MATFRTNLITNCTCSLADYSVLTKAVEYPITITANDGYIFETAPTINNSSSVLAITPNAEKTIYTGTITLNTNYAVSLTANGVQGVTQYAITNHLTNCTSNITSGATFDKDSVVHVTATADNGYYFATAPTLKYYSKGVLVTKVMLSDDTEEQKTNFYFDLTITANTDLYGDGQVIPEVDKYGIITIYNPTPSELKDVGNVRYLGGVDLGNFISSLIKVYVKIPQGNRANILLGGYQTNVESNVVVNDIIETDCGVVEIVGNYNNAMDYENTTIEMYMPFVGFVELDTKKVMNQTISLIYKTNVINGDTIACIYNLTGTLLYTFNTTASFEIPYKLNADNEPQGQLQVNSNYLFGFTPFVTVRYNKTLNTSTVVANDERLTKLVNESGYIRCSEVFNTINATTNEKEEIETLLKGGVIV